ncbi:MAG: hypothetical protein GY797_05120 [Deltaproteobacteria bacterium]|nr:hypothetical protein [Deltaproteobacteria bacterium]
MNLWILAVSHLLHILGTVVWIGGILMTLLVILPSTKAALESAPVAGKMMKEVAKRFTPLANLSILLLIATGIIIFCYDKNYTSFLDIKNRWIVLIAIKHLLVAIMIIIHFYRGLILSQKIEKSSLNPNETQTIKLKKLSLDLVKANFVLGIMVLLFTAVSISI